MNRKKIKLLIILIVLGIFIPGVSFAREYVSDWYIKEFSSEIVVNKDSTLTITESIIADCGNLLDKHGIFRILPTQIKTTEETIQTPIELISITDFFGKPIRYKAIRNIIDHTITWKIGDPDIVVSGENQYRIKYKVKNAIRFNNSNFDEFYWNLNGNFWDIETDSFMATIEFPKEINRENADTDYYTGYLGEKGKDLAVYRWVGPNTLQFYAARTLLAKQGITVSITFSKSIFTPYKLSIFEKYNEYLGFLNFWYLLPLVVFIACFVLWRKYGNDPNLKKTVIPEFEIPENLTPIQVGVLMSNGSVNNKYISATIIDLAVKGFVSIEEIEKKGLFDKKDFKLKKLKDVEHASAQKVVLDSIFALSEEVLLSSLKKEFYKSIPHIKKQARSELIEGGLITKKGLVYQAIFFVAGIILLVLVGPLKAPAVISGIILVIFSFIMPKRTMKGAEALWRVKGFRLYMKAAEKYRQQFYEKENIFEKYLPYAMVFGITKEWIKKMEQIYGADYFQTHVPVWYIGTNISGFDVNSFASHIDSLSSSIALNVGGPSGSGGAGGAGGGAGGGGGGGW